MNKTITILLLLTLNIVGAQSIKKQILDNLFEIKSVDINSNDFSDLDIIGNSVGDAKIVFLGEQAHGDATTFEAKSRIIKYLHEKKGFNILVFENYFFSTNKKADEKQSIDEIEKTIFSIWSKCAQVNPLFEYIKKQQQKNPITISGFDCQISQNSVEDLKIYFDTMALYIKKNVNVSKIKDYGLFQKTLKDLIFFVEATENKNAHFRRIKKSVQRKYFKTLSYILNSIEDKNSFLYQSLGNAESYAKMAWKKKGGTQSRDTRMGENILWLNKFKFPNEKMIIWAHSGHLNKKLTNSRGKRRSIVSDIITAGEYVCDRMDKDEVYSIGFSSRKGASQRIAGHTKNNKKQIIKPSKLETFENWVNEKQYDYAFVNFKNLKNNSEVFHMRGIGHESIFKVNGLTVFDGIFYIEEMFPCIKEE